MLGELGARGLNGKRGLSTRVRDDFLPYVHGLRTVAVLAVLAHHLDRAALPGGYIGVDVFFVISGYLITSHIVRRWTNGQFTLRDFYLRRVRRILPNQLLIVGLVLAISYMTFDEVRFSAISESAVYSALLASNFYFWQHAGYFAPAADTMPLLHMWSLGIEEQFYLVWPAAILGLMLLSTRPRLLLFVVVFSIMLVTTQYVVWRYPEAAFYLMPFRITEFMCGAALAILPRVPEISPSHRQGVSILGLLLIIGAAVLFDSTTTFPGVMALIPCVGTAMVIAYGRGTAAGNVLGSSVGVAIGERSYALYLVHWPVIVFLDRLHPLMDGAVRIALVIALTFTITEAIFQFWEKPLRYGFSTTMRERRLYVGGVAASIVMLVLLGTLGQRESELAIDELRDYESKSIVRHCVERDVERIEDCTADLLVVGDSHAHVAQRALERALSKEHLQVAVWSFPGCPPIFGAYKVYNDKARSFRQAFCRDLIQLWERSIPYMRAPVIVLAARWGWLTESGDKYGPDKVRKDAMVRNEEDPTTSEYSRIVLAEQLSYTIDTLVAAGKKVVLMGQAPLHAYKTRACVERYKEDADERCQLVPVDVIRDRLAFMNSLIIQEERRHPDDVIGYFPVDDLCTDTCRIVVDGKLLYSDASHLSPYGSTYLAGFLGRVRAKVLTWLHPDVGTAQHIAQ